AAQGHEATLQADGWTGLNSHHLIAFMVTVNNQVHTVQVDDVSAERKTADNLLDRLQKVIDTLNNEWKSPVIAVVTDASGESRKARRLLGERHPELMVLDCYAHQLADDLISWLRSKTLVLALIREQQLSSGNIACAVIRAVITRWTAHFVAYRRLIKLRRTLMAVASTEILRPDDKKMIITGDKKARQKALTMLLLIQDHSQQFWKAIERITRHLEPLAIAANITQATQCRLYQVLLTFGFLMDDYLNKISEGGNDECEAIIASLEARWAKADQELFISSVILNPFYRTTPFAKIPALNNAGVHMLIEHMWERLFSSRAPPELESQAEDYLFNRGLFAHLDTRVERKCAAAQENGQLPDPIALYSEFCFAGEPIPAFILLARRLLLVSANSASCERLFSIFGTTLTKLRSRLGTGTLQALAELKMMIRDEHTRSAESRKRMIQSMQDRTRENIIPAAETLPIPSSTSEDLQDLMLGAQNDLNARFYGPEPTEDSSATDSSVDQFHTLIQQHMRLSDEDELDDEPIRNVSIIGMQIPLRNLFNFANKSWSDLYKQSARQNFEEEMSMYELLELDSIPKQDES
ncbi:hypothetical protein CONPUDRAFT_21809, partial [Coniophora puteana RWD-64-598 SS2]